MTTVWLPGWHLTSPVAKGPTETAALQAAGLANWPLHVPPPPAIKRKPATQARTFMCYACSDKFTTSKARANHTRRHKQHTVVHACPWPGCGKIFARSDGLRRHFRCHT